MTKRDEAWEFIENYFVEGKACEDCPYKLYESDTNYSACNNEDDPTNCPALPEELYPPYSDIEEPVVITNYPEGRGK